MSKNRIIYNQVGTFIGPCPSTGYHFLGGSGNSVNSMTDYAYGVNIYSYNLVQPLIRVIQASYGFNESRVDVKSIGNYGTLSRPIIAIPTINLQLSYYSMGLINESRLGFIFNQPSGNTSTNKPLFSNNACPISGFIDRKYNSGYPSFSNTINSNHINYNWPLTSRDCHNIFIATSNDYDDLNYKKISSSPVLNGTQSNILTNNIHTYAFGDCYLNSYKFSAQIGQIPQVDVDFTCHNLVCYDGGSGNIIPSINPKDMSIRSGITFNLPPPYTGLQPSVLLPSDISLNISNNNYPLNFPFILSDIKIQGFSFNLDLNREPLTNLGYKLPLDRRINFPVFCSLDINAIVGDIDVGNFSNFVNQDDTYDVNIKLNFHKNILFSGTAINFSFFGSKFQNISISESIEQKRMVSLSLMAEINPLDFNNGFFISGQLGIPQTNYPIY